MVRATLFAACLLLFGPAALAEEPVTILGEGTAAVDTTIDCGHHSGRILASTGVHYRLGEQRHRRNGVSIGFLTTLGDALECNWVQFVWITCHATFQTPNGNVTRPIRLTTTTSGGDVETTTDPANPKWFVDAGGESPAYEVEGACMRDGAGTTIFDQPGGLAAEVGPDLVRRGVPVVLVEDAKHFDAYLVCNKRVCFKVSWTQRYTWRPGQPPVETGPTYDRPTGEPDDAVLDEQRAALDKEHPGQTVLRGP